MKILAALLRKEFTMLKRNPLIPRMVVMLPLMVMLVLPLVTTLDIKNVKVAVIDFDNTPLSRRLVSDIDATSELTVNRFCTTRSEAMHEIENGNAEVLLTIPRNFLRDLSSLSVEANGVNATTAMLGAQYVTGSVAATLTQYSREQGIDLAPSATSVINRYNPTLNFRNYMIPALITVLILILCGFLPTLNFVAEKESGTIEAINVTPVGKLTFVLSKLIPFWIIGLLVLTIGIIIGWLVYGLVPSGSLAAIYLAAILFSLLMSAIGVCVANGSDTMLQSVFVMFAIVMICQLMGGLFTPIDSMPRWAQLITWFVPPRYFNEIMRAVYLRGASVGDIWPEYAALALYSAIACVIAALTYRKQS